jgi:hypothetical protein
MKKLLVTALAVLATSVFAGDSVTLEGQHIDNIGSNAQSQYVLTAKKDITSNFAGDVAFQNAQTQNTEALSTRLEFGLTGSYSAFGPIGVYTRAAVGEKYTNTTNFGYYSIEPGVVVAVPGVAGLGVKAGYRFRTAIQDDVNHDETRTGRIGASYAFTKNDSVGVRYDRVSGDSTQKVYAASYTRSF